MIKLNIKTMDNYDYVALTNEVVRRGANLFGTFEEWTKGAFALSALGENGRVLFKNISKLSDKYNEVENDKKFTNALRTNSQVSIASFIYMCQQKGIDTNKFFLKDGYEVKEVFGGVVADVVYLVWRDRKTVLTILFFGSMLHDTNYSFYNVIYKSEITLAVAIIENLDGFAFY